MNKEELDKKLKDLVKRTLDIGDTAKDLFNEARDLKLQKMAIDRALTDLEAGKSEIEVLGELEKTVMTIYAKNAEELETEVEFRQKTEEQILSKEAADEASQDK
ncbi:hypothetical protein KJ836_03170 [Patescibacteria group bacterium]|nr:hypothetical protein [Patescibacteria group bacterium]